MLPGLPPVSLATQGYPAQSQFEFIFSMTIQVSNKRWQEQNHHGLLLPASLAVHPRGQSQPTQGGQKRLSQLHGPLIIWARNIFHPMKVQEKILILCVTWLIAVHLQVCWISLMVLLLKPTGMAVAWSPDLDHWPGFVWLRGGIEHSSRVGFRHSKHISLSFCSSFLA